MSKIKKAVVLAAATGGLLAVSAGTAAADADGRGFAAGSPGVLSGNVIQVPIHIPVNLCGNSIDVIGILNPAFGNPCLNVSDRRQVALLSHRSDFFHGVQGYKRYDRRDHRENHRDHGYKDDYR